MSKRSFRIFDAEDLSTHKSSSSCWVSRNGRVYDITALLPDHPGGDDIVLKFAGGDIGDVMQDKTEHEHSDAAYDMMEEFCIGRLGSNENIVDENWVATDDFHPDDTEVDKDYAKHQFIDLRKPMLRQVWEANFSKQYYLRQIHQPRHVPESARMFGPDYLEVFTRTNWYVVPIIWLPIAGYLFLRSVFQFTMPLPPFLVSPALPMSRLSEIPPDAYGKTAICFFVGTIIWTLLEYLLHRFLFHVDYYLPDKPAWLTLHFLMHGVHHYLPMDRLRLVMPPLLFTVLEWPFTRLAYILFPVAVANGIISGAFLFYVLYDCMHYALHHTQLPAYLKEMKKYHLGHHYKNYELGFGVTSKVWDIVFNTYLPV
ncbi:inositolphosphorylceramide-b c-26 hydroxylase [Moniliophthora roreri MCA 2997]|uniref:Ceramide very long chain fatty acid hydroxylase n=2 Tax=Moniliophthora roreri TaxID=221103 RepID=V2XAY9_MONRO|nr:inositolphosphorylceramide-b c-26 hydroxylase [Moniliophthora roreri MCA 2997]